MIYSFFLFFVGCPKPVSSTIDPAIEDTDKTQQLVDQERMQAGTFLDGVFRDKSFPLEGTINDSWTLIPQNRFGSRRLLMKHVDLPVTVEIWHFQEVSLQPAKYDFCSWGFIDRGFYGSTQEKYLIGTCVPDTPSSNYVFAYLHHWVGSTWQFEVHAHPEHAVEGKKVGEDALRGFIWRGDGDIPILPP